MQTKFMKLPAIIFVYLLFAWVALIISCKKEYSSEKRINKLPPVADAGRDTIIILPDNSAWLDGTASSDPDNNILEYNWTKIHGPSSSNINTPTADKTKVDQLSEGIYQFELKVTDADGLFSKDTVRVTIVKPVINNRPPVANAGVDQTISLPTNNVMLNGSNSSDPDNNIITYSWMKISGPASYSISDADKVQTQVTNLIQGNYQFELKVTDAGNLFSLDTVSIYVNPDVHVNFCDNSGRNQVQASLIPIGSLSEARAGISVISAGNKIFFAGAELSGFPQTYGSSRVDIYDIVTQTWSSAELSERRSGIAAIAAGNKIFFAGGRLTDGAVDKYFSTVDIYDLSTDSWSVASLSEPRCYIAAATVGNKVFFAGGVNDQNYKTTTKIDIYDLASANWTSATLSTPRANIAAVTVDNKIYFAGGNKQNNTYSPSDRIDIYNNSTGSWSVSSLKGPMGPLAGIAVSEKIYWAQGCAVEIKDINTGSSSVSYLFRSGASWIIDDGQNIVLKDGKLVFFRHSDAIPDKFDIYDVITNTWSIGVLSQPIPKWASIIAINNTIYIVGGAIDGILTNQVWKLEF